MGSTLPAAGARPCGGQRFLISLISWCRGAGSASLLPRLAPRSRRPVRQLAEQPLGGAPLLGELGRRTDRGEELPVRRDGSRGLPRQLERDGPVEAHFMIPRSERQGTLEIGQGGGRAVAVHLERAEAVERLG